MQEALVMTLAYTDFIQLLVTALLVGVIPTFTEVALTQQSHKANRIATPEVAKGTTLGIAPTDHNGGHGTQPADPTVRYEQATKLRQEKKIDDALTVLAEILRHNPSFAEAYWLTARFTRSGAIGIRQLESMTVRLNRIRDTKRIYQSRVRLPRQRGYRSRPC